MKNELLSFVEYVNGLNLSDFAIHTINYDLQVLESVLNSTDMDIRPRFEALKYRVERMNNKNK